MKVLLSWTQRVSILAISVLFYASRVLLFTEVIVKDFNGCYRLLARRDGHIFLRSLLWSN